MTTTTISAKRSMDLTRHPNADEPKLVSLMSFCIVLTALVFGMFCFWSNFARIDEIASSSGSVIPNGYVQSIQHLDGGIVKEILVQDGQIVKKGQVLLKLDGTNADADLGQMHARQISLQSQSSRLKQFVSGKADQKLTTEENAILSSMLEARASQQNILRDQIVQKQQELQGLQTSQQRLLLNIQILQKETVMHQTLAQNGTGSQLTAMNSERELNAMQGQLEESYTQSKLANAAITEARSRQKSLNADLKEDAMKKIGEIDAELSEISKVLSKAESKVNRTIVVSPVDGIIKGLTLHTLGAVVEPGKVLMEIVPMNKELVVEAMVQPSDIGNVHKDQSVKVKVSAFDFSRFGFVQGKVKDVSASTFMDEKGNSFYKVKVNLDQNYVGYDEKRNQILPGMIVQADIVTGNKTILQYLLKPIHMMTSNAFHER